MADPLFWLALSFLLVVISLTAVLMVAIPVMRELGRAARSAEKMFDTLSRELPPTLEAIRLTGLEITELTDDVTEGVQSAGQVVKQVNQGISTAQSGAKRLNTGTKSLLTGAKAAWRAWTDSPSPRSQDDAPSLRTQPELASRDRTSLPLSASSDSPAPDRHSARSADALDGALAHREDVAKGAEVDPSFQRSPQEASRQTNYD
ncbi:MAG: hypothetical protein WBA99_19755 [Nodosilinea sp.]